MKKRIIKIFASLLIFSIIFEPFSPIKEVKSASAEGTPNKGDLRCPPNVSGCIEIKNSANEVVEVQITAENSDFIVTKYVKKKEIDIDSATYTVSLRVEPKKAYLEEPGTYVVLVMDTSGSIDSSKNMNAAKQTASDFSKALIEDGYPINVAMVQFATDAVVVRGFAHQLINTNDMLNFGNRKLGIDSIAAKGLNQATALLTDGLPANAIKYIVFFGDGDYKSLTNFAGLSNSILSMNNNGIYREGIRFKSDWYEIDKKSSDDERNFLDTKIKFQKQVAPVVWNSPAAICSNYFNSNGLKPEYNGKVTGCYQTICRWITGGRDCVEANDATSWKNAYDSIAARIKDYYNSNRFKNYSLVDEIGSNFVGQNINEIPAGLPYSTKEYEITLTSNKAKEEWENYTDKKFSFKYQNFNGVNLEIASTVNPQVYWKNESTEFDKCSGDLSFSTFKREVTGIVNTFKIDSDQKYLGSSGSIILRDRYCTDKMNKVSLGISKVSGKKIVTSKVNEKSFDIIKGIGFPIEISFDETVQCVDYWNEEEYNKWLKIYSGYLNSATDPNIRNFISAEIKKLQAIAPNPNVQIQSLSERLNNYRDKFMNDIKPKITVKYNDGTIVDSGNKNLFVNENANQTTDVVCNESKNSCRIELNKNMQLKNVCTSLKTGEIIDCDTNSKNQVIAGNNYYIGDKYFDSVHNKDYYFDKNKTSGTISVEIDKLGFHEVDVTMKDSNDPACTFNLTDGGRNVFYRQIDIRDPFVQQFKSINQRKIGRNFSNEIYKFVNYENDKLSGIIDPNIWNQDYEYLYKISKTNVRNIKKDTGEQNYLGTDCYIKENTNQYICPFTRNLGGIDGTDKNYFYSADIK